MRKVPFLFKCNPLEFKWVAFEIVSLFMKLRLYKGHKVIKMLFTSADLSWLDFHYQQVGMMLGIIIGIEIRFQRSADVRLDHSADIIGTFFGFVGHLSQRWAEMGRSWADFIVGFRECSIASVFAPADDWAETWAVDLMASRILCGSEIF